MTATSHNNERPGYQLWLFTALFMLAVIVKAILLRTYLNIDSDRSLQLVAAAEWARGFGYTIPESDIGSINIIGHQLLLEWPPLYSAMLVPLIRCTNDYTTSCFIMDTLGAFLYLWAIWKLTIQISFNPWLQMMVVWFKATEIFEGLYYSFPTDFLAAACWLWAIYFFLRFLDAPEKKWFAALTICMAASFLFRYVYLTALPVLPFLLWYNGQIKKRRDWKKVSIVLAFLMLIVVLGYLGINKIKTGSFTYLENWDKGFFPEKLLGMVPLIWQSVAHVTFFGVQVQRLFHQPYIVFAIIALLSSQVILLALFYSWVKRYDPFDLQAGNNHFARFMPPAFWVSAAIIFTLAALSIRIDFPKDSLGGSWSYLVEDRYFLVPLTVVTIVIVKVLFGRSWINKSGQLIFRTALLLLFFIQILHTGYIIFKRLPLISMEDPADPRDPSGKKTSLQSLFHEGQKGGNDVVLLSKEYGDFYVAWQKGIKVCRQVNRLDENGTIGVTEPTMVVLSLTNLDYKKYKPFLDKYHFEIRQKFMQELHLTAIIQPAK